MIRSNARSSRKKIAMRRAEKALAGKQVCADDLKMDQFTKDHTGYESYQELLDGLRSAGESIDSLLSNRAKTIIAIRSDIYLCVALAKTVTTLCRADAFVNVNAETSDD